MTNYQIVNGCQTSNVIFECLNSIDNKTNDIYIPIRLISTEDEDTKHAIIKATNSQTQLKPEQLVALSSIQKL
ncbi:AIPR family protein [Clostridioides difficile]|nr:AIPR family protein [Clostridioides difficile]